MTNVSDSRLAQCFDVFGKKVLLVPCHKGTKVPIVPYKDRPTNEFMTESWQNIFAEHDANIAVVLGRKGGNLISIDMDDESDVLRFQSSNPDLCDTLITTGARGLQMWFRMKGDDYPGSCATNHCEWRSDGNLSTFCGVHPKGMEYRVLNLVLPKSIEFDAINWMDWDIPSNRKGDEALQAVEAEQGEPFFTNDKGIPIQLNEPFWAAAFLKENNLVYDLVLKSFWIYRDHNGLWERTSESVIAQQLSRRLFTASKQTGISWLARQRTAMKLSAIVSHIRGMASLIKPWESEYENFVHLTNGMLLFRGDTMVFDRFSPDYRSKRMSPIIYDDKADCPEFKEQLLNRILPDEDVALIQRFAGMFLLGRNILQKVLIMVGGAGTGKSQLLEVLSELVGEGNWANLRTAHLDKRFEYTNYMNKSLLIGADVPDTFLNSNSAPYIKALVGGDRLMAELKGSNEPVPLVGEFNVAITSNSHLRINLQRDQSAWKRRLVLISFKGDPPARKIAEYGRHLVRKEGAGILNWAIEGLRLLFADLNSECGDIQLSENQIGRVEHLLAESDSVRMFLMDNCRSEPGVNVSCQELHEAYTEWCLDKGLVPFTEYLAGRQFRDVIPELFGSSRSNGIVRDGKAHKGYSNVGLKHPPLSDDDHTV